MFPRILGSPTNSLIVFSLPLLPQRKMADTEPTTTNGDAEEAEAERENPMYSLSSEHTSPRRRFAVPF